MTKFQTIQLINFLKEQKFTIGCLDIREYERAKKYLFPYLKKPPIENLDYDETIGFLVEYLKV